MSKTIYEMLALIRKRPMMFIGKKSVSNMHIFLNGFQYAQDRQGRGSAFIEPLPFAHFNTFVSYKYQEPAPMGWSRIILSQTDQDEEQGLDLFFKLLDEFCALKVSDCMAVSLTEQNKNYHETADKVPKQAVFMEEYEHDLTKCPLVPVYIHAVCIYCVQFTNSMDTQQNSLFLFAVEFEDAICCEELLRSKGKVMEHVKHCFGDVLWETVSPDCFYQKPVYHRRHITDVKGNGEYWV